MEYRNQEIKKVIVRIELWELDDDGIEIDISDEKSNFAGFTFEPKIDDVFIMQDIHDSDCFYVQGGNSSIDSIKETIDEWIIENKELEG